MMVVGNVADGSATGPSSI